MSRYRWDADERDAYDAGHKARWSGDNPHNDHGESERLHSAWDDGLRDRRAEDERAEERRREEEEQEYQRRRAYEREAEEADDGA